MLITYQKIAIEQYNQVEQVSILHHAAWHLLKKSLIIGQTIGIVPTPLNTTIIRNEYKKPYLAYHPNIYFNLSHTLGCVACVISTREIGIDIEKIRSYKEIAMRKTFTDSEKQWVKNATQPKEAFFRLWTLKESIVKAEGIGISQSLKQFEFQVNHKGKLYLKHNLLKYSFNQILIDNQFILSTCKK